MTQLFPAFELETTSKQASPIEGAIQVEDLAQGLWIFSSIRAPNGLHEEIYHEWYWENRLMDRIKLEIIGGREEGFRSWSRKEVFPNKPQGSWKVMVTTSGGQLLGSCSFEVIGAIGSLPSDDIP